MSIELSNFILDVGKLIDEYVKSWDTHLTNVDKIRSDDTSDPQRSEYIDEYLKISRDARRKLCLSLSSLIEYCNECRNGPKNFILKRGIMYVAIVIHYFIESANVVISFEERNSMVASLNELIKEQKSRAAVFKNRMTTLVEGLDNLDNAKAVTDDLLSDDTA